MSRLGVKGREKVCVCVCVWGGGVYRIDPNIR